MTVMTTTY